MVDEHKILDRFSKTALAIDLVLITSENNELKVLLTKRTVEPYKNAHSLPGSLIDYKSDLHKSAQNMVDSFTKENTYYLKEFNSFNSLDRHPNGRVVTTAFLVLTSSENLKPHLLPDLVKIDELPTLAFDHKEIIDQCFDHFADRARYYPLIFYVLPELFTSSELRTAYEQLYRTTLDVRNFSKKFKQSKLIVPTELKKSFMVVGGRRARLHKFDRKNYQNRQKPKINLDFE